MAKKRESTMPTAARLVAAVCLGAGAFIFVPVLIGIYPEEPFHYHESGLTKLFLAIAVFVGWYGLGRKVNTGRGSGIGLGFRASLTMFAWALSILSIWYGIGKMRKHAYYEPVPAVLDMFEQLSEYAFFMLNGTLIGLLLGIGIVSGVLADSAAKRWK